MKPLFAFFTDVHGNVDALRAVIEDARSAGTEHFICGGDMIGIGPFPNEVLEVMFSLPSIKMVTGNHDEAVLALKFKQPYPESHDHAKKHHQWCSDRIHFDLAIQLLKLPRELDFTVENRKFLITHYPFKHGKKESPISEDPFLPIVREPSLETMQLFFNDRSAYDFIGFGHHHIRHDFINDSTFFVNPGALGCNTVAEARYALVYGDEQGIKVVFRDIRYDRSRLIKAYKEQDVPDASFLLKAFHSIS
ncbi:metallophosphatase family protein [Fictibacillus nanhaiensis]|uniref:metallophosphoesterase family protein n=1 Tax=Fictibacillus nanhaiensis TaxID=742169 RepID=UPI001C94E581|nr:metallophosphoesterase family protein [Fictibacillus nanhaiensis]MBY6038294.1 metallophosphatase family protein [Fictibacillus nanhaiensis]